MGDAYQTEFAKRRWAEWWAIRRTAEALDGLNDPIRPCQCVVCRQVLELANVMVAIDPPFLATPFPPFWPPPNQQDTG